METVDMNDQEKSVVLARVMGWKVEWNKYGLGCVIDGNNNPISGTIGELDEGILSDLYESRNMALAWRVLNWANDHDMLWGELRRWWSDQIDTSFFENSPDFAQRLWLDKVLDLAIEAGLVEV